MAASIEPSAQVSQESGPSAPSRHSFNPLWLRVALALSALAILIWQIQHYAPFFSDDGFISLRYSQRLLDGQGLTWTNGERVEGYSNLSYVLLSAIVGFVVRDLVFAARCVGFLGVALMAWALWINTGKGRFRVSTLLSWNFLVCIASVTVWALGGLEATLYAGAIILGYAQHFDRSKDSTEGFKTAAKRSWPLALACLTRPDGPLFVVVLVGSELVAGRFKLRSLRSAFFIAFWPFMAFVAQLAFRLAYYGDWVPNTAYIKANTDADRAMHGVEYLEGAFTSAGMLIVFALGAWLVLRRSKYQRAISTAIVAAICWSSYVASVGGDIFPAWRHALVSYALLLSAGSFALRSLFASTQDVDPQGPLTKGYCATLICACAATALAQSQRADPGNERAAHERWEWDAESLGPLYKRFLPADPLLAIEPAGALPFFSELSCVDMYGLCDAHISRQEPHENQRLAHEYGDAEYIWKRAPDLIVFGLPTGGGPGSSSGVEMTQKPEFRKIYQDIQFKAIDPVGTKGRMQVRKAGKVGIQRTPNSIFVPGYFLKSPDIFGYPIGDSEVGARLRASSSARTEPLTLDQGVWRVTLPKANAPFSIKLRNKGQQALVWQADKEGWLIQGPAKLQVDVSAPSSQSMTFLGLSLDRVDQSLDAQTQRVIPAQKEGVLHQAPAEQPRVAQAPEPGPQHFVHRGQTLTSDKVPVRPECGQQLPGIHQEIRLDTYELGDKDEWTGTLKGPIYRLPERAIAHACISGGSYNAGLRLRSLDTGKVIASWSAYDSSRVRVVRENLSDYAGATVQFEAYDGRTNGWGHVRVFGLDIVAPPSS